ncbi:hypothetical protein P153DRAFT_434167 [Dothidotthia symphoricarpi CBS 119687]|uniref:Uncharacterized protein n=1 Tax=Dothidotthia symphoricarpi CBS 119687 TaxID=1392245 RepID=A0A6A6A1M7_9PLEO|nr:uncharacterized protein P153DRAFT_434167 [Dothidotthia symphoricarpi CBS 119687]KAF2125720.1 hypothetical protein P153DRAFT_434167 [Dothidotthia symphoricarpi CBS 119687]
MSTAAPQTTNMVSPHSPSKAPSRYVLSDMTPTVANAPSESTRTPSPLKRVTSHVPSVFAEKENLATSDACPKGRKRSIDEVDDVESTQSAKTLARGRDAILANTGMPLTAAAMQQHTENNPIGLLNPGSPTERDPSPEPEPIQASQMSNNSFSNLFDYSGITLSQKSEDESATEPPPTSAPIVGGKKSRAELLRTRLQLGIYKVKTNQVSKRGADIISIWESHSSIVSDSIAMISSAESNDLYDVPNITVSSPQRNQQPRFVQANLDPFQPIGKLGLPPIHFAVPNIGTHVSSRMIHDYSSQPQDELPQSVSPQQLMSPVRKRIPSEEETAHQRLQMLKGQAYRGELASSAVKGDAATGLLELKTGRR